MNFLKELPRQIIRDIIIRTPYTFHNTLKEISEECKAVVESDDLSQHRIKIGESEKFICLLHEAGITMYDPARDSWHPLPPMPAGFIPRKCSRLVFWRRKLVVIGLEHDNRAQSVLVYHFGSTSWHVGRMQSLGILSDDWRFGYSASAEGSVYVPPGQVYMIDEERREDHDGEMPAQLPSGVSIAGMGYLFNTYTGRDLPRIFDPKTRTWNRIYGLPLTGRYDDYLLGLCRRWGWNKIFLDDGAGASTFNSPLYRRFYMFQADTPRWIHIQTPGEIGNRTVLSVTTAEI
ncbi:hypothetical protein SUGI_0669610 [Cryptomeria japonica]|nr:hypothetical protein SUGI_0669610 [Cryptomeria japonica]